MKSLWNYVNQLSLDVSRKNHLFLALNTLRFALIGLLVWIPFSLTCLKTFDWMICFIGYPLMFPGLFGGILYLYNHEF